MLRKIIEIWYAIRFDYLERKFRKQLKQLDDRVSGKKNHQNTIFNKTLIS